MKVRMPSPKILLAVLLPIILLLSSCASPTPAAEILPAPTQVEAVVTPTKAEANMPDPASRYCTDHGGKLAVETGGDGGQFAVCYFEDNRQCEEWALMRGECPMGGLKVTGYVTPAGRYCAIRGGTYAITSGSGASNEQGTCTLKDGTKCDAGDYYNGKCVPGALPSPTGSTIQPLIMEVCDGEAQAMAHALDVIEVTQSEAPLNDPVTGVSGTGCMSTITGNGAKFKGPDMVAKALGGTLVEEGWAEDQQLAAGGPTGIGTGYRKDNQICLVAAGWKPDASANCPSDQPITACNVTPEQKLYTIILNCGLENTSTPTS